MIGDDAATKLMFGEQNDKALFPPNRISIDNTEKKVKCLSHNCTVINVVYS